MIDKLLRELGTYLEAHGFEAREPEPFGEAFIGAPVELADAAGPMELADAAPIAADAEYALESECVLEAASPAPRVRDLDELLEGKKDGFGATLLKMIDASGKSDVEVYRAAGIDRKHFSKIRSNPDYKPTKNTALALAVALELNLDRTNDLLRSAGLTLSDSSRLDLIVSFFIERGHFDLFDINEALYLYGESLLGS